MERRDEVVYEGAKGGEETRVREASFFLASLLISRLTDLVEQMRLHGRLLETRLYLIRRTRVLKPIRRLRVGLRAFIKESLLIQFHRDHYLLLLRRTLSRHYRILIQSLRSLVHRAILLTTSFQPNQLPLLRLTSAGLVPLHLVQLHKNRPLSTLSVSLHLLLSLYLLLQTTISKLFLLLLSIPKRVPSSILLHRTLPLLKLNLAHEKSRSRKKQS